MENNLVIQEARPLTVQEVKAQINLIQQVMKGVMKENTHYGKIPGCGDKPTLLKAGAEKILATFRLSVEPVIDDLSVMGIIRYRVSTIIKDASGRFLGTGIGECSSEEEKYHWRKAVCQAEFDATPEDMRREKWVKGWNKPDCQIKQIKTNSADIANTILKMAKKRALVDGVLTVTGASDIFAQDLEDLPAEVLASIHEEEHKEKPQMPQAIKPELKEEPKNEEQTDKDNRLVVTAMLKEMNKEDAQLMGDALEMLTEFTGKDKTKVKGVRSTANLKGTRLRIALENITKDYEKWKQKTSLAIDGGSAEIVQ